MCVRFTTKIYADDTGRVYVALRQYAIRMQGHKPIRPAFHAYQVGDDCLCAVVIVTDNISR